MKKAGSTLRKYFRGELAEFGAEHRALEVMEDWRGAHYVPLVSANNGLRSRARTIGVAAEVTQRLKRSQTILDKLKREPTLDLSRMQDIGGCRAVVNSKDDLRALEERILRRLDPVDRKDYISEPRASGYRGVHIVVKYQERAVEIQLRTKTMHSWALATESYSQVIGENLKQDGDHPIQKFLKVAADIMALSEDGISIPKSMTTLHQRRRLDALPYLSGGVQ